MGEGQAAGLSKVKLLASKLTPENLDESVARAMPLTVPELQAFEAQARKRERSEDHRVAATHRKSTVL